MIYKNDWSLILINISYLSVSIGLSVDTESVCDLELSGVLSIERSVDVSVCSTVVGSVGVSVCSTVVGSGDDSVCSTVVGSGDDSVCSTEVGSIDLSVDSTFVVSIVEGSVVSVFEGPVGVSVVSSFSVDVAGCRNLKNEEAGNHVEERGVCVGGWWGCCQYSVFRYLKFG